MTRSAATHTQIGTATLSATPSELQAIESAVQLCRQGHEAGRDELFEQSDDAFHLGAAEASHNPFLLAAVRATRRLQQQASVIGMHGARGERAKDAVAEHAAICKAIRQGDPDAAAQATSVHLDKTLEDYRRDIQRRLFSSDSTENR